jgi:hypothetical protein
MAFPTAGEGTDTMGRAGHSGWGTVPFGDGGAMAAVSRGAASAAPPCRCAEVS